MAFTRTLLGTATTGTVGIPVNLSLSSSIEAGSFIEVEKDSGEILSGYITGDALLALTAQPSATTTISVSNAIGVKTNRISDSTSTNFSAGTTWIWRGSNNLLRIADARDSSVTYNVYSITFPEGSGGGMGSDGTSTGIIYRRSSTQPDTPTTGAVASAGVLTTAPTDWSLTVPTGTEPLYVSFISITGSTINSYGTPVLLSERTGISTTEIASTDISITIVNQLHSTGITGWDSYDWIIVSFGKSTSGTNFFAGQNHWVRTSDLTDLTANTAGTTIGTTTDVLGLVRSVGTLTTTVQLCRTATNELLVAVSGNLVNLLPLTISGITSSGVEDGTSTDIIYRRSTSTPNTPTGGAASSGSLTTLPSGWGSAPPSGSNPLYVSFVKIDGSDITYGVPARITGETGAAGSQGIQGIQGIQGTAGVAGQTGLTGSPGIQGSAGADGRTPRLSIHTDGNRRVIQLEGYTDSEGTFTAVDNPTYVSASGYTTTLSNAVDIRGLAGTAGAAGVGITSITVSGTTATFTFTDGSTDTFQLPQGIQGVQGVQGETGRAGTDGTVVVANPGGSPTSELSTVTINDQDYLVTATTGSGNGNGNGNTLVQDSVTVTAYIIRDATDIDSAFTSGTIIAQNDIEINTNQLSTYSFPTADLFINDYIILSISPNYEFGSVFFIDVNLAYFNINYKQISGRTISYSGDPANFAIASSTSTVSFTVNPANTSGTPLVLVPTGPSGDPQGTITATASIANIDATGLKQFMQVKNSAELGPISDDDLYFFIGESEGQMFEDIPLSESNSRKRRLHYHLASSFVNRGLARKAATSGFIDAVVEGSIIRKPFKQLIEVAEIDEMRYKELVYKNTEEVAFTKHHGDSGYDASKSIRETFHGESDYEDYERLTTNRFIRRATPL